MAKNHSLFDYTITLTRKYRYLVVGSPEFGLQICSTDVTLDRLSPEAIGASVLKLLSQIDARIHQLRLEGKPVPPPLRWRLTGELSGSPKGVDRSRIQMSGSPKGVDRSLLLINRDWLATREAARALGVSASRLRALARQGVLPATRTPGGHLRFPVDALAEHLAAKKVA